VPIKEAKSASGQTQTSTDPSARSASPLSTDIVSLAWHVRYVPNSGSRPYSITSETLAKTIDQLDRYHK
jgi:hypothetical protein